MYNLLFGDKHMNYTDERVRNSIISFYSCLTHSDKRVKPFRQFNSKCDSKTGFNLIECILCYEIFKFGSLYGYRWLLLYVFIAS